MGTIALRLGFNGRFALLQSGLVERAVYFKAIVT
jgi:hypothetical protein